MFILVASIAVATALLTFSLEAAQYATLFIGGCSRLISSMDHSFTQQRLHRLTQRGQTVIPGRARTALQSSTASDKNEVASSEQVVEPVLVTKLQRMELGSEDAVGAGYDLIQARIAILDKEPEEVTLMLDSGLTTNLISPELQDRLNLTTMGQKVEAAGLASGPQELAVSVLPSVELLGEPKTGSQYRGVWEGAGWRAQCTLDWDAIVSEAAENNGLIFNAKLRYTVLPSSSMTEEQLEKLVGAGGVETVEGELLEDGTRFIGRGVSVEPKGFLAATEKYDFHFDGDELVESVYGTRFRHEVARDSLRLPGSVTATCVPFTQAEVAKRSGIELGGMLGQLPLHVYLALEVNPAERSLKLYRSKDASTAAAAAGMVRLPGILLGSALFGVQMTWEPLAPGKAASRVRNSAPVQAMVDSGSSTTIINWPAAEQLFGFHRSDRIIKEAPLMRAFGVGGGNVDMPLVMLSVGLVAEGPDGRSIVRPKPVQVAIGDADIFEQIVGREESGSWLFGLGPRALKPAALIGQDILSQQPYILAAVEPAMYITPASSTSAARQLQFVGVGDCVDTNGQRLQGLQKLGCAPDEAARECLQLGSPACQGVAVTPTGRYQGLCYIFVDSDQIAQPLTERGWKRYEAPPGQQLAPIGAQVATADGTAEAECFTWQAA